MRMMIRITLPNETANARIADGSFQVMMKSYMEEIKPEALYFVAQDGFRTAYFFADMKESSQLPVFTEPAFLAYGAKVEVTPAMNLEDLGTAMPAIEAAVRKYAK